MISQHHRQVGEFEHPVVLVGADVIATALGPQLTIYVGVHGDIDPLVSGVRVRPNVKLSGTGIHKGWRAVIIVAATDCARAPIFRAVVVPERGLHRGRVVCCDCDAS